MTAYFIVIELTAVFLSCLFERGTSCKNFHGMNALDFKGLCKCFLATSTEWLREKLFGHDPNRPRRGVKELRNPAQNILLSMFLIRFFILSIAAERSAHLEESKFDAIILNIVGKN